MIDYSPFWRTLKNKNITQYALNRKYNFSNTTLARIRKGQNINTATIDQLCKILDCKVEDIILYVAEKNTENKGIKL